MKRKIFGLCICMLLLATIIPTISATQPLPNEIKKFKNCYFVADGLLTDKDFPSIIGTSMWKIFYVPSGEGRAYVLYWFLRFNETATVTIYSEQNGEILWQHQGMTVPQLRILSFSGLYTAADDGLHISGKIGFVQIIEK